MMVSLFPHIKATTNGATAPIAAVLDGIRAGQWQREVEAVREQPAGSQAYDQAKRCLPYFTPSGTFERRTIAGLVEHSGFMSLDLDAKHNPDTNWNLVRVSIEADPHTYACFLSTGGQGLCVLVPVPTTHHKASFRALERYYLESFGLKVDSLPDVSRARFVSYDPALFLNPEAEAFAELLEEVAKPVPPRAAPISEASSKPDTESILLAIGVKMIREAADGGKHVKVRDAAYLLGGYVGSGYVDETRAYDALYSAVLSKENVASTKTAEDAIRSGLRKGALRPILPDWLQFNARQELRDNNTPGGQLALAHRLHVAGSVPLAGVEAAIKIIVEEQAAAHSFLTFWNVHSPGQDKPLKVALSLDKFTTWLAGEGFRKYRAGGDYATVLVQAGVVREVDRGQLFDHVLSYLAALPFEYDGIYGFQVRELVLTMERKLFDERFLQALPSLEFEFMRDTAKTAYYFFLNGWVEVSAAGIVLRDYEAMPAVIWAEQVRPHTFQPFSSPLEGKQCDFHAFTRNVSGGDADRLAILRASLGYLLHGYKEEANAKCIIFVDEVATTGKPDGRTGKSLLIKAVSELVAVTTIAGATFRFEDSFRFQRIQASTRVAYFDEWDGRRLPFKKLFTEITSEIAVNRKNHSEFTIPFAESPKFAITTNDVVSGEGGSHEGRKIEIPLAPHYSSKYSPIDEFGRGFFADGNWSEEDWNYFFNLALGWVQDYLAAGRQLQQLASAALDARKLEDSTSPEFLEYTRDLAAHGNGNPMDSTMWADETYQAFLAYSGEAQHRFPMRRFYQWMGKVGFVRKQWKGQSSNRDRSYFEPPQAPE